MELVENFQKEIIDQFICGICLGICEDPQSIVLQNEPFCHHLVCRKCVYFEVDTYGDAICKKCNISFEEDDIVPIKGCLKKMYKKLLDNLENEDFMDWVHKEFGQDFSYYQNLKYTADEDENEFSHRDSISSNDSKEKHIFNSHTKSNSYTKEPENYTIIIPQKAAHTKSDPVRSMKYEDSSDEEDD